MNDISKRERKRQNRLEKIERIQAAQRRTARMRFAKRVGVFLALFALVLTVFWWQSKDSDSKASSSSTTTTTTSTTSVSGDALDAAGLAVGDKYYLATITTDQGVMTAALNETKAPKGVKQFVTLAKAGFYNGLTFHRVVKGFMIQGGDPKGDGTGGVSGDKTGGAPTTGVGEAPPNNSYTLGDLAYAKTGDDPAFTFGSQFFVVTDPAGANTSLTPGGAPQYGWFGRIVSGIDVATKISEMPVTGDTPTSKITISSVEISALQTKEDSSSSTTTTTSAGSTSTSSTN